MSGALYGLCADGVTSGFLALIGNFYVRLIATEARRLGTRRTAIVHAVGVAFAAVAFTLLFLNIGSDKVGIGLYCFMLVWTVGAAAATGSFGGVVITMALAMVAMVHGTWGGRNCQRCPRRWPSLYRDIYRAAVADSPHRNCGV